MSHPEIPPPPSLPTNLHVRGHGWSVMVPTAIVCAAITALTNWAMRPSTEAHAAAPDTETRQDIRELRSDVKQILSRLGGLEDAVNNQRVVEGARGQRNGP